MDQVNILVAGAMPNQVERTLRGRCEVCGCLFEALTTMRPGSLMTCPTQGCMEAIKLLIPDHIPLPPG